MPPDIHVAGDANIGGDLVGRDKTTRVSGDDTKQDVRDLAALVGKLQSDMVSVRLQLAITTTELAMLKEQVKLIDPIGKEVGAMRERDNFKTFGGIALIIVTNLVTLVIALFLR